ncbi:heavy metal translocating P-type ATPase [Aliarcobacter trophiarum LMG 25534]|uniref:P-type Zn(2+) transporter n=1 Tax=Aliarcobacter trophiarum LMG 25534 TaxID=1032241 RepID=A0AAD0QJ42_9BACT|nr:heavy metal translocating P-type ATPase [Aliarcobacter trophiarum]AXK48351.1 heavy metal translocating P-type ATPase [Aliarcobacter trophiarum LMG 25534]RXI28626.1 heavy metal translocating P-type ATPase [Aliarcobacter trophiarum]RXJ92975.1 heavy metal translocating P-type ATPase [Aliarcobacter trophiarum LMG 25534]
MDKKFIKVHQIGLRARYKLEILKDNFIDEDILKGYFSSFKEIKTIRINKKAYSIIFELREDIFKKIEEILKDLSLETLLKSVQNSEASVCVTCVSSEKPSMKATIFASSALISERLVTNSSLKAVTTTVACTPLLIDGIKELFKEGLTSHVLEAAAVAISIFRKDYLAANSTNAMLELGEYIEETTVHKSDDLLKELAKPNIEEAWVEKKIAGKVVEVLVKTEELKIGDIIIVGAGSTIAIDGHIIDGAGTINQVSMTGEATPIAKYRGDRVISGTIVEEGRFRIWAEQVGSNTATQRIKHYIENSLNEKSSAQLKANKLANKLVPVTLGLATAAYIFTRDFQRVASVLQADYSCALKLATPVAFKSTISKAGHNGIMIKGAKSIEALSSADTFVFDKTGTLTGGELEVVGVDSYDRSWSEEKLLNLTASTEEHYFHPVAEAVVKAAKERGFVHMHHEEVEFIVAHGVKTEVKGKSVIIGSRHFLEDDEKIDFKPFKKDIENSLKKSDTLLYVGYDGKLLGTIGLADNLRENSKNAIKKLKTLGVKNIVMLTGDIKEKALKIADELGIDEVKAELLPQDKANIVKELMSKGKKVAFIGDGINDAPALISSHVGISMSRGADIAKATADISLLKDDIEAVVEAKEFANKTMNLINTNFNATVGINSAILLGATFGLFSPIVTAILHNGTTIGLLLNSIRGVKLVK